MHAPHRILAAVAALLVLPLSACLDGSLEPPGRVDDGPRILFIGNSLTYYHDVPGLVAAFGAASGFPLTIGSVALPNLSLADHWSGPYARASIAQGGWSVVVLQQGPSAGDVSRDTLRAVVRRFADEIHAVGARTGLYAAYPGEAFRYLFDPSIESYRLAAQDVNGLLFPVSTAWLRAWDRDPALQLYSDGLHASPAGAYLSALVIYGRLAERSPIGLPSTVTTRTGARVTVPPATAAVLQEAAAAALAGNP